MSALHREHLISWLVPVIAGLVLGIGLHGLLAGASPVDVAARDRRTASAEVTRSHRAPPQLAPAAATPDRSVVTRGAGGRDPARPGVGPAIAYAPRDPSEWQGMLVNTTFQALCDTSSRCGLAMACHAGRCGPCASDAECAAGEVCAMQHCVSAPLATCRGRADCPSGELCMLTGYADDARGNGGMHAYCSGSPPAEARRQDEQAALDGELAREDRTAPAPGADPATPEGLVHLLQE
jgi:hypothetical protein